MNITKTMLTVLLLASAASAIGRDRDTARFKHCSQRSRAALIGFLRKESGIRYLDRRIGSNGVD